MNGRWRPSGSIAVLRQRADLLAAVRSWFAGRAVLEVETPVVVRHTVSDPQLASFALATPASRFLQTSPEYAMKRLLAAGSGDIYQICRVFRDDERSRLHNPEFTMIEWYRLGFDLPALVGDTAGLVNTLLARAGQAPRPLQWLGYREALTMHAGCDPLEDDIAILRTTALRHGLQSAHSCDRDALLDFLVAVVVGPKLGLNGLCALHHYPASQAALAQLDPAHPGTALRFELYAEGVELANGYVELADGDEQRRRFAADARARDMLARPQVASDQALLAALDSGLPPCAGVAVGFDRVVMLALGARGIDEVIAFPWEDS